jgi:hypothetical protein
MIAHLEAGIDFAEDDVDIPANAATIGLSRGRARTFKGSLTPSLMADF